MKQKKILSIEEAVNTLNALAAIDPSVDPFMFNEFQEATFSMEEDLDLENSELPVLALAKDCFKTVHEYLLDVSKDEDAYTIGKDSLDKIKSMMLLAGEAAKKLDSYIFSLKSAEGLVFNLDEYRELQDFYREKVNPVITQEKIGRWVLGIGKLPFPDFSKRIFSPKAIPSFNPQHLFIELDTVRSDSDYELFFIRKESGGRFFNPRLIRNMQLITEFGFEKSQVANEPPIFLSIYEWLDTMAHAHALQIIRKMGSTFDFFTMERGKFKEKDLQNHITKTLLALLLASQAKFLIHQKPTKSCYDYFNDFMEFFRETVRSYDYQKLISYPPRDNNKLGHLLLNLIQQTARMIFLEMPGILTCKPIVNRLIVEGYEKEDLNEGDLTLDIGKTLESDQIAINSSLKYYGNSSLAKTLDELERELDIAFDPYFQKNLPNRFMDLVVSDEEIHFIRLPCPTIQKSIDHPLIIEEFKAALRGLKQRDPEAKTLVFNFQNRSSWKENKRCLVLEDLQDKEEWNGKLFTVTMEIDTDFYEQRSPFDEENSWSTFREYLIEHLMENHETMFLPENIQEVLHEKDVSELIKEVHQIFFKGANTLTPDERKSFIDLTYLLIQLKIIDQVGPKVVAFTCKDGIESSNLEFALMYASMYLFNNRLMGQIERETLNTIVFAPALLFRERAPDKNKVDRLVKTLKLIESVRQKKTASIFKDTVMTRIARLFKTPILEGQWFS